MMRWCSNLVTFLGFYQYAVDKSLLASCVAALPKNRECPLQPKGTWCYTRKLAGTAVVPIYLLNIFSAQGTAAARDHRKPSLQLLRSICMLESPVWTQVISGSEYPGSPGRSPLT